MANIIDSLSIELGLDISKFKRSQQEVLDRLKQIEDANDDVSNSEIDNINKVTSAKEKASEEDKKISAEKKKSAEEEKKTFEQSDKDAKATHVNTKKTADGFDKARDSLIGLSTAFFGLSGLKELSSMVSDTAKNTSELGRQSTLVGVDPKYIQSWGVVGQAAGAAEEDVINALQNIRQAQAQFIITGGSADAKIGLGYLGLNENEIDKLDIVADKVKAYIENRKKAGFSATQAIQEAQIFTGNIGYTEATFKMLLLGGDKLRELQKEYEPLIHFTDDLIKKSDKLNESSSRLSATWIGLKNTLSSQLLPSFTDFYTILSKVVEKFTDFLIWGEKNREKEQPRFGGISGLLKGNPEQVENKQDKPGWRQKLFNKLGLYDNPQGILRKNKPSTTGQGAPITNEDTDFSEIERANELPSGWLKKIRKRESEGNDNAVSHSKTGEVLAEGPFGIRPSTGADLGLHGRDAFDVGKSSKAAGKYLGDLLKKYHDMDKAIAAYNWGPGNVDTKGMGNLPKETRDYIAYMHSDNMTGAGINTPVNTNNNSTQSTHFNISGVTVNGVKDADGFMNSLQSKVNNTQMVDDGTVGGR